MSLQSRIARVHQYHSGSAKFDAVTNSLFYVRSLLRELGFESEIFCSHVDPQLASELRRTDQWNTDEADVLVVHHSIGIDDEPWLAAVTCKKVLVYHNITPVGFFANQPILAQYVLLGLEQVQRWRPMFEAVIADSEQNRSDLVELGYPRESIEVVPLLLDIQALRSIAPSATSLQEYERHFNVVFVGRLVENKCQLEIVRAYARTHTRRTRSSRLILVGGTSSEAYVTRVREEAQRLGVADELVLTGKIPDDHLAAVYCTASVFVCLSEHEGFGVPLVEAMVRDIPIIALAAAAVPWTLGNAGIQFPVLDLDEVAVAIDFVASSPVLRSKILVQQRAELTRFGRDRGLQDLRRILQRIGTRAASDVDAREDQPRESWRVEGPIDSSYSLAILNRNLGRALQRQGRQVDYLSTEGGGDQPWRAEFLQLNPDIAQRVADPSSPPTVILRNLYPPRCTRMDGVINTFALYGWEESTFPHAWANAFNRSLNVITTMSGFVTKLLVDSGVKIPIRTVGCGTDHYLNCALEPLPIALAAGFRFLHNSSCFPRKGADALLAAYGRHFSGRTDVALIIKTFANPHNDIVEQVARFRTQFPRAPTIQIVMDEFTDGQMASLYAHCHALVAPSRGEGFGLPIAEAMWRGIPVIVTAYSGQMDFCNDESAYLVDYQFAYAKSHFEEPGSVWADPNVDSLGRAMLDVVDGDAAQRQSRIDTARARLQQRFTWDVIAGRQSRAIEEAERATLPALPQHVRTALISTWNTRCGIAAYADFLTSRWRKEDLWILADQQDGVAEDLPSLRRCWRQGSADAGKHLLDAVLALEVDAVVIQYNFGFFPLTALAELICGLADRGKICLLTLHATKDVDKPDFKASLRDIRDALARCSRILVHSLADCNRLKQFGLVDNVLLFPHGTPPPPPIAASHGQRYTIGTFGYALPHKGLREVIEACALLRERGKDVALQMLNARYPIAQSDEEIAACRALIASKLGNQHATFDEAFHSDAEIAEGLRKVDLLILAYQETGESSSAAVRSAMSAGVPIVCTPLEIFEDVKAAVDFSTGGTPEDLCTIITSFMDDPHRARHQLARRRQWQEKLSWPILSERLANVIESLCVNR